MRERGILIAIRGHTIPDDEDDALLLTHPIIDLRNEDCFYNLEIRCAMDAPLKWTFRPEWENDTDPWPDDEGSAIC